MSVSPIPKGYHSVQPYLVVDDAKAVVEFCERAFDAEIHDRHDTPDGSIAHADIVIGDSHVMIGQASGDWPALPTNLYVYVEDCDRVYATALEAGAESVPSMPTTRRRDRWRPARRRRPDGPRRCR